jgi:hypothetical protein
MATDVLDLLADEALVPLADAVSFFPRNARPAYKSVCRWVAEGVAGVRLPARRVGVRLYTSRQAVEWFSAAVEQGVRVGVNSLPRPRANAPGRVAAAKDEEANVLSS